MGQRLLFAKLLLLTAFLITQTSFAEDKPAPSDSPKDSADVLTVFTARIKDGKVNLNWKITNPKNISYFEVLSHDASKRLFETLNRNNRLKKKDFIERTENENGFEVLRFNYEDQPSKDGVYFYKIKAIDSDNKLVFESDEIKIGISGLKNFKLEQNSPNPFNPSTTISYELFEDSHVKVRVFDLIGKEIATLVDEFEVKGQYKVSFDASQYSNLTSGIYFYKLDTERYTDVKKMILTK